MKVKTIIFCATVFIPSISHADNFWWVYQANINSCVRGASSPDQALRLFPAAAIRTSTDGTITEVRIGVDKSVMFFTGLKECLAFKQVVEHGEN